MDMQDLARFLYKLSGRQVFYLVLLAVLLPSIMTGGLNAYSMYESSKHEAMLLQSNVDVQNLVLNELRDINSGLAHQRSGYVNLLNKEVATRHMELVLYHANCRVVGDLMVILASNNIHSKTRQDNIKTMITKTILNYYKSDMHSLEVVFYKGRPLSDVWFEIDPYICIYANIDMLFADEYQHDGTHTRLVQDLVSLNKNTFNTYAEQAKTIIDEW